MHNILDKSKKFTLEQTLANSDCIKCCSKTKIVCTLGPACWSTENLIKLIDAGVDVCRFNFSHGDHEAHQICMNNLREAMKQRPGKMLGLMLDTKGPEIRTGKYSDGLKLAEFKKNQELKIVTDYNYKGDNTTIACNYEKLSQTVKVGSKILIADGSLICEVTHIGKDHVITKVLNDARIGEHKNMNLPGAKVDLPVCGQREINDIVNFGIPNSMHYIAASFVQTANDVLEIRKHLGEKGKNIMIIPKIENLEGLINFESILEVSDGIMVARGDLGMELPLEKVFIAQKLQIEKCLLAGKPVITATQMLESMINAPRPTRAEVSDVANAVLDGSDCVMLSGESANGAFFDQATKYLKNISTEAEQCINFESLYSKIFCNSTPKCILEYYCASIVKIAFDAKVCGIICLSKCGKIAQLLAKYRPNQLILVGTPCKQVASKLAIFRGVRAFYVGDISNYDEAVKIVIDQAMINQYINKDSNVILVKNIEECTLKNCDYYAITSVNGK